LAATQKRVRSYAAAETASNRALRLLEGTRASGPEHRKERASILYSKAEIPFIRGIDRGGVDSLFQQARTLIRQSLDLWPAPGTVLNANRLRLLGETLAHLRQPGKALAATDEALEDAQAAGDRRAVAYTQFKRGRIYLQLGRLSDAERDFEAALQRIPRRRYDDRRRVLRDLGRLHELRGDWAAAAAAYRKGVSVVETYRSSLRATDWSLAAFSDWQSVYRGLARALLAQDRTAAAFRTLERTRARHLTDLRVQARVTQDLSPAVRVRFDSLTRVLERLRTRQARRDRDAGLQTRIDALIAERRALIALDSTAAEPAPLRAVQSALRRQDRALVAYMLDAPWRLFDRSPRSVAFVVTPDTLRTVSLDSLTQRDVTRQLDRVSPLFRNATPSAASLNAVQFDLRPLAALYDRVYVPVREALTAAGVAPDHPLTIVPDGPLHRVPFPALVRSMPGGRFGYRRARFLLHERATATELSGSLLANPARYPTAGASSEGGAQAGVGASAAAARPPRLVAFGVSQFEARKLPGRADSATTLSDLPGVRTEIEQLRDQVPSTHSALDDAATEAAFHAIDLSGNVLHLASHALVRPEAPLQNAIVLAADTTGGHDGLLYLHEIRPRLSAALPLVVLSGCGTAQGQLYAGEGLRGLQYAFRAAGAQATLGTLWPADDRAAVDLTTAFYRYLQDGRPKDAALRQARLDYLDAHPERSSPFFWAANTLSGRTASVPLPQPTVWSWWLGSLVGVAALALLAWGWRRRFR
jgi:CHAT domain-containing protein